MIESDRERDRGVKYEKMGRREYRRGCITAGGNILVRGKLCFRVFKLQLKVINKNFVICTVHGYGCS